MSTGRSPIAASPTSATKQKSGLADRFAMRKTQVRRDALGSDWWAQEIENTGAHRKRNNYLQSFATFYCFLKMLYPYPRASDRPLLGNATKTSDAQIRA